MIRRLIEADVARAPSKISASRCRLWLQECRSYELLRDLARRYPEVARGVRRPALRAAITGNHERAAALLKNEEDRERQQDRLYWAGLPYAQSWSAGAEADHGRSSRCVARSVSGMQFIPVFNTLTGAALR
jgi:hypothetical protein